MIIECIQQQLISWIGRHDAERSGDGKAEHRRCLVIDQRAAHRVELCCGEYIQQGGTGDQLSMALAAGQHLPERVHAAIDDHCFVGQRL